MWSSTWRKEELYVEEEEEKEEEEEGEEELLSNEKASQDIYNDTEEKSKSYLRKFME